MKEFIKNEKLTDLELHELRHRLLHELGWSYQVLQRKYRGATEFTKTDYKACQALLEDIRLEQEGKELPLYSKRKRRILFWIKLKRTFGYYLRKRARNI